MWMCNKRSPSTLETVMKAAGWMLAAVGGISLVAVFCKKSGKCRCLGEKVGDACTCVAHDMGDMVRDVRDCFSENACSD